jgi:hypothetical protein
MNSCIVFNMFSKVMSCELDDENWRPTYDILPEHVDHSNTIREFITVFETEIFLSWFTNILNLIYFPLQIVNKN